MGTERLHPSVTRGGRPWCFTHPLAGARCPGHGSRGGGTGRRPRREQPVPARGGPLAARQPVQSPVCPCSVTCPWQGWADGAAKGLGRRRGSRSRSRVWQGWAASATCLAQPTGRDASARAGGSLPVCRAAVGAGSAGRGHLPATGLPGEKQPWPELHHPHRDVGAATHHHLSSFPVAPGCRALLDCTQRGMSFIWRALCLLAVPWRALVLAASGRRRARD